MIARRVDVMDMMKFETKCFSSAYARQLGDWGYLEVVCEIEISEGRIIRRSTHQQPAALQSPQHQKYCIMRLFRDAKRASMQFLRIKLGGVGAFKINNM